MRRLAAVTLLAAALGSAFAPAAAADPWPLCVPHEDVQLCLPICFGTHDNWQCIPWE